MIRIALLLAVTGIVVLMLGQSELSAGVLQGTGTGTIQGVVFEDLDGDGVQDPGESGLHGRVVRLRQGPTQVAETSTGADGSFSFTQVAPGAYTVSVDLHAPGAGLCIDSFGGFDPLRIDDCYQGQEHWVATNGAEAPVNVSAGAVEVNFGLLQSAHPMTGVAILNGDYAPVGTPIAAMSGETECGVSTVTTAGGRGLLMYQMEAVNSNGEKGCPEDGEDWTVLLGGQPAATVACCDSSEGANLIVLPDHAWYWAVGPVIGSPAAGTAVQAFVGDVLCGQTVLEKRQWVFEPHVGIERLVVPSEALAPGCGRAGATVAFMIGDYEVTAEWQAGISYIELPLESVWGDVQIACDGAVTIGDALMIARWLVGFISLDPWPPCFWIGAPLIVDGEPQIWGDVDCNGAVSIGDAVKIARHLLGLPVQQTQPCPEIGAKILVQ